MARLLAPFLETPPGPAAALAQEDLARLSTYLDLLLRWNARINLTAVRNGEDIVRRHFGESFFAARQLFPLRDAVAGVIDLGSGAGFPGLPLKIYAPGLRLSLIESNHKKATFLKEAVRTLELVDVNVFAGRAEEFPTAGDLVTVRAVERYQRVLESAARLVLPGGRLGLLIGTTQAEHTPELLPRFAWSASIPIPESAARVILIGTNPPE